MASQGHSKQPEEAYDDDDLGGTGNAEDDAEETFAEDGEGYVMGTSDATRRMQLDQLPLT